MTCYTKCRKGGAVAPLGIYLVKNNRLVYQTEGRLFFAFMTYLDYETYESND